MIACVVWDRAAAAVTGRRSWLLGLSVVLLGIGFMVLIGENAAAGQAPLLTQLGIIVGLGILLDTSVVRTLVIPALFAVIGDRIWWPTDPARTEAVQEETALTEHERSTP